MDSLITASLIGTKLQMNGWQWTHKENIMFALQTAPEAALRGILLIKNVILKFFTEI